LTNEFLLASFSKVNIFLQPYVAKYLATNSFVLKQKMGFNLPELPSDVVYLNGKSNFGRLVIDRFEYGFKDVSAFGRLTERLTVWICDKYRPNADSRYSFLVITKNGCTILNDLIKEYMMVQLHSKVLQESTKGVLERDSIIEFLRFFEIEEDVYSFESCKKAYYRWKKNGHLIDC